MLVLQWRTSVFKKRTKKKRSELYSLGNFIGFYILMSTVDMNFGHDAI